MYILLPRSRRDVIIGKLSLWNAAPTHSRSLTNRWSVMQPCIGPSMPRHLPGRRRPPAPFDDQTSPDPQHGRQGGTPTPFHTQPPNGEESARLRGIPNPESRIQIQIRIPKYFHFRPLERGCERNCTVDCQSRGTDDVETKRAPAPAPATIPSSGSTQHTSSSNTEH